MRIGEILVAGGHLNAADIELVLRRQVVHGGRFGTCAVEITELELDRVADALAEQHGLPAATARHFSRADAAVLRRVSPELAARHRAIALGWLSRDPPQVAVASMDPLDPDAVAELSEYLRAKVVPAIAPELRILYYLERVYGIERLPRFRRAPEKSSGEPKNERRHYVRTLSEKPLQAPQPLARIAVRQVVVGERRRRLDTVGGVVNALAEADDRETVGELGVCALEAAFNGELRCGVLFAARDGLLMGWKGFVAGRGPIETIESVALDAFGPSMLREPFVNAAPYFGPPQGLELDHLLWSALELGPPGEVAVVPVVLRRRVVSLIYADAAESMEAQVVGGLAELGQGLAAAFDRLVTSLEEV